MTQGNTRKQRFVMNDLTGQRFGILTPLYLTEKRDRNQSVIWHCRCDCGNEIDLSCGDLQRRTGDPGRQELAGLPVVACGKDILDYIKG